MKLLGSNSSRVTKTMHKLTTLYSLSYHPQFLWVYVFGMVYMISFFLVLCFYIQTIILTLKYIIKNIKEILLISFLAFIKNYIFVFITFLWKKNFIFYMGWKFKLLSFYAELCVSMWFIFHFLVERKLSLKDGQRGWEAR